MGLLLSVQPLGAQEPPLWDTHADTWSGTDALGRRLPGFKEVGPPRADRTVAMFYFLWLGPHSQGGLHDIRRILEKHPEAFTNATHSSWGGRQVPHHWGESVFGYYQTHDPYVLRKHAQLLADAQIDVVVFDVSNQVTYRRNYLALLEVFDEVRRSGGRVPQVAFLCPFWDPNHVVRELYRELYQPGLYPGHWFRWEGKPLILADPQKVGDVRTHRVNDDPRRLEPGRSLGQTFASDLPVDAVAGCFPTWRSGDAGMTLRLRRDGPLGAILREQNFRAMADNGWTGFRLDPPLGPGTYYLEASDPHGSVGWWSGRGDVISSGQAFEEGRVVEGDRSLQWSCVSESAREIQKFFTFRTPQPDYFQGQTSPDMWSWLEVYPQHAFTNRMGEVEQMSVGVAQNAVGGRLGSMSEKGARGRSFHVLPVQENEGSIRHGLNFAEQWNRALKVDPRLVFVTGWNEWIAGRFSEFNGVKEPVMFVDQFDQEHSRDIEPMRGGHGDDYYYQLVDYVRRYKGVRKPSQPGPEVTLPWGEWFGGWDSIQPEYRDDRGDAIQRAFEGYAGVVGYTNRLATNDILRARVARDRENLWFEVEVAGGWGGEGGSGWMWLLLNVDGEWSTGWNGYDFRVRHELEEGGSQPVLERYVVGRGWRRESSARLRRVVRGAGMQVAMRRVDLGLEPERGKLRLEFKWVDQAPATEDMVEWLHAGDMAPNGRFNYRYEED